MLCLSRRRDESIRLTVPPSNRTREIVVMLVSFQDGKARLGFEADDDVVILRSELVGRERGKR